MLLENLKEFDWLNEPYNVRFDERGMRVIAKYRTDFWCCARYDFRKDDGHFFFSYVLGDFCCEGCWEFTEAVNFDQCGLMVRADVNNWFKVSVMYENVEFPMMTSSLTADGFSDLATIPLQEKVKKVWYRIKRRKGSYVASYSLDGENYVQLRKFYLVHDLDDIKVGAYICSPQREDFEAVLRSISFTD